MTSFQSAFDRIKNAASTAGLDTQAPAVPASDAFARIAKAVASVEPGAAPGGAAGEQDIMRTAAQQYEGDLLVQEADAKTARYFLFGFNPREIERGFWQSIEQTAQAVATPGLRAQFIESVLNPLFAVAAPWAKPTAPMMGRLGAMATEPAGSGLTVDDLRTEQIAARGAAMGRMAGAQEGVMGDISRALGQTAPQMIGVAAAVATGGGAAPIVAANLMGNANIPLSAWTAGQLEYFDEIDQKRAEEALSGQPLSTYSLDEMRKRATVSAIAEGGTELVGGAVAGKVIAGGAKAIIKTRAGRATVAALSERGRPLAEAVLASRAGQAGAEAFARASDGTLKFRNGFFGQAGKIVAASAAEEGAEELGSALIQAPFNEAPLSDDLKNGLYSAFIGGVAGGVGGVGAVGGAVAARGIQNRRDAFRPETNREIRLRQAHTDAMKARTNWSADLDESQQARVSVALNSLDGMAQEERGIFLRELADRRQDIANDVEAALALRQQLNDALAGARAAQQQFESGAPERAAKDALVKETEAALAKANADFEAAREMLAEAELATEATRSAVLREERQAQVDEARREVEAAKKRADAALSEATVAEGLEIAPGLRINPAEQVALLEQQIADIDAEMQMSVHDKMIADATYNAVREKVSDMPMDYVQRTPQEVLAEIGADQGTTLEPIAAPKNGARVTREMQALGLEVQWFRGKGKKFSSPGFFSMSSRNTVFLNADYASGDIRATAMEELFHQIQMFRPEIAQAYSAAVGVAPIYEQGIRYSQRAAETAAKARLDEAALQQAGAAIAEVGGEQAAVPESVRRAGAARLQQEGEANLFARTAGRLTRGGALQPFVRFAARRGLMGREVYAAMSVIDAVSRAAAIERVAGKKPSPTLSPLARTLLWAEDADIQLDRDIADAERPEQPTAEAAQAPTAGVSMAREFPSRPLSSFTSEWRQWFSDSKVVDADGNPRVVYHGTWKSFLDVFRIPSFFSENPQEASAYAEAATFVRRQKVLPGRYKLVSAPKEIPARTRVYSIIDDIPASEVGNIVSVSDVIVRVNRGEDPYGNKTSVDIFTDLKTGKYELETDDVSIVRADNRKRARSYLVDYRAFVDERFPAGVGMGGRVYPVYLSIKNPIRLGALEANRLGDRLKAMTKNEIAAYIKDLESQGYDGIETTSDEAAFDAEAYEAFGGVPRQWIPFRPNQIKSVFNERPTAAPGISMARASDEEYFAAIERGDMTAVQAMVDAAARAAGYIYSAFHGSRIKNIVVFRPRDEKNGMYFSSQPVVAGTYTGKRRTGRVYKAHLNFRNPLIVDAAGGNWSNLSKARSITQDGTPGFTVEQLFGYANSFTDKLAAAVRKSAFDGIIIRNVVDVASGAKKGEAIPSDIYIALEPTQIKSADPITRDEAGNIIPLSKRFDVSRPEISFARASDAEYLAAVERGDMATAQRMADAAANAAGYDIVAEHQTNELFTEFRAGEFGFHVGTGLPPGMLGQITMKLRVLIENPLRMRDLGVWSPERVVYSLPENIITDSQRAKLLDEIPEEMRTGVPESEDMFAYYEAFAPIREFLKDAGYDGIVYRNEAESKNTDSFIAFDPEQLKSADPVTRDEAGNVIPLSRRFDVSRPEISFARASDEEYFAAIERGDMTAVQAMVDAAARAAGYLYDGYHASRVAFERFLSLAEQAEERGEEFDYDGYEGGNLGRGFYFTPDKSYAKRFGTPRKFYLKIDNIVDARKPEVLDRLRAIYNDLVEDQGGAAQGEAYDALVEEVGADGVIAADAGGFAYGAEELLIKQSNQAKLADPIVRDTDGNIIPLSKRFDVSRPEISFARPEEDAEIQSLREQVAELKRQIRDVQNVTAAQRVNAMREVRVLERRIVTAERLAEQKTLQATRAKARLALEQQARDEDKVAADAAIAKMETRLDASIASVKTMRADIGSLRRTARNTEREIADAEEAAQRAIDWAYAIGRNAGRMAGEIRGQQVKQREVKALTKRLEFVEPRLQQAREALREARKDIKADAAAAQRAIDFAYGMGLAKGRLQGVMEGRRQVLARMAKREDALQNQMFNLRRMMQARADQAEEVRDAAQSIARDAASTLPVALRGPLAVRIAGVKTLAQANRIAVDAVKLAANNEVDKSVAAIRSLRKAMKKRGMRISTRTRIEQMLNQAEAGLRTASGRKIRAAVTPAKGPMAVMAGPALVNAVEIYAAVVDAATLVEQAALLHAADRQAFLQMRAARIARYDALRQGLAQAMTGRPTLQERERGDQPPRASLANMVGRANSDIYTLMLELEGTEAGVINDLLTAAQAGKGEASLEHASILRQLLPALQAAGYESIDQYALVNGLLGEASTQTRDVVLGGQNVTLPIGTIMSLAAMDDETLALFPDALTPGSQQVKFAGAASTKSYSPTKGEIRALLAGLSQGERDLIAAMKNILETQIRDRVMDAVYAVEGDQPPIVQNYWPRVREAVMQADAAAVLQTAGMLVRGALTSVGFAQARTGGRQPLIYRDAFQTWERHVQVALDMIHMAQPYRDAATVLTDPEVVRLMDMQMGDGTARRVLAIFSNGVGATARSNPTIIDKLTNNVTGAVLAMNPRTLAKVVVGGQIRLASEIPAGYWARGVARAARQTVNPRAWNARVEEIHSLNGYFNRRHQLHMRSIVSGSLSDADRVRVTTAFRSMADSFRSAGQNLVALNLTDAAGAFRDASNGANMMIASVVDALRYMDEQIMLAAVEARLAEVEDEGVLTGQDALREAALRAERDFRRTQNASDEFDDTAFAAYNRVQGTQGWRLLFPFSSDPLKARNQIRRAYLSGNNRLATGLAIGGNMASSTIIGALSLTTAGYMASLVAGLLGGGEPSDEDDKKFREEAKYIPANVAAEALSSSLGYSGIVMSNVVQSYVNRRSAFAPIAVRPIEQVGREVTAMTAEDGSMLRIIPALLALSQFAGFPAYQLYKFIEKQVPKDETTSGGRKPAEPKTERQKILDRIERRRREIEKLRQGG